MFGYVNGIMLKVCGPICGWVLLKVCGQYVDGYC